MNPKLIKEISERVRQVKAMEADEQALSAHLDAIAEVYGSDRETVESIARDIIAQGDSYNKETSLVNLRNTLWVSLLMLMIVSVVWLLFNNLKVASNVNSNALSKSDQRTINYVKEALASLNLAKVYIAEHVATVGQLPTSFQEIGTKESDFISNKYIDEIKMESSGKLVVGLSPHFISDKRFITLQPTIQTSTYTVEWDCRSNLELAILDEINGCTGM